MSRARATTIALLLLAKLANAAPDDLGQAKEHYRRGTQLYDLGKYLDAANEYQEAFKLTDRPAFLFNIGQAYRLGGKPKDALATYEGFLRRVPNAPQRSEVEQRIAELKQKIQEDDQREATEQAAAKKEKAERAAAAADEKAAADKIVAAPVVVAPPRTPIYRKWWLWTAVAGVAVVAVGVGVGVGVVQSKQLENSYGILHYP